VTYGNNHEAWFPDGTRVLSAFFCNCIQCGVTNKGLVGHQTREKAIAAWNRRIEAAQALEAKPVAWRVRGHVCGNYGPWRYFDGPERPPAHAPAPCDFEPLYSAPSAQVAQEGGGLASTTDELLEPLEDMARQHCHTSAKGETDSGALSTNAQVLRLLAKAGRFRIDREAGRMVVGYWPENDPKRTAGVAPAAPMQGLAAYLRAQASALERSYLSPNDAPHDNIDTLRQWALEVDGAAGVREDGRG